MLGSSPVALPPLERRAPKRSASVASLPTPPRTRRRPGKRRSSRAQSISDSDHAGATASSDDEAATGEREGARLSYKKRRMSKVQEADDEDAFWMGSSSGSKTLSSSKSSSSKSPKALEEVRERSESPAASPVPLVFRRLQGEGSMVVAPMSPPPSRRHPRTAGSSAGSSTMSDLTSTPIFASPVADSPPVTPVTKSRGALKASSGPMRDSPDNPFLASPVASDDEVEEFSVTPSEGPSPKTPPREKPTLTYVFRGVKTEFINPLYDHVNNRPLSPDPNSRLPPEHPDYTGDLTCPPTLLFPEAHRRRKRHRGKVPPSANAEGSAPQDKRKAVVDPFDDSPEPQRVRRSPRSALNHVGRDDMMRLATGPRRA